MSNFEKPVMNRTKCLKYTLIIRLCLECKCLNGLRGLKKVGKVMEEWV